MAFSTEVFSDESYGIASSTADRINGTFINKTQESSFDIIDIEDALILDEELISIAYKPNKKTLLHYYMESYFIAEWNYLRRKSDTFFPKYILPLLNELNIQYKNERNFTSYEEYNYHLYNLLINNCNKYINEAFNILFENRNLMKNFNILVSELILKIEQQQYPKYLSDDGRIKRYPRWNKWLKDALFYREKGCCAHCGCDLSGTVAIRNQINIVHIVPLTRGGTNDPTNLQILCSTCNKKNIILVQKLEITNIYFGRGLTKPWKMNNIS